MTASESALQARIHDLHRQIRQHKSAVRQHREALSAAKAELTILEATCRRIGIRLVLVPRTPGEGAIHGRPDSDS